MFLVRLEQILALYALPYDPAHPVICFDERPCFLIGDTLALRPMRKSEIAKQHYEYEKLGSCSLLAAIEPLTGRRLGQIHERRTKREFTQFCQLLSAAYPTVTRIRLLAAIEPLTGRRLGQIHERCTKREFTQFCQLLSAAYPTVTRIRLVLDNLNTHNASSFYEHLSAEEAYALAARFEFIYTPKSASWLNMIECEFSVISRQCLDQRIATIEHLRSDVLALLEERDAKAIKIHWQLSIQTARSKLNRHYARVNPVNEQYKET